MSQPLSDEPLRIIGTARDPENNKGAAIYFNRPPTDDELRAIQDTFGKRGPEAKEAAGLVDVNSESFKAGFELARFRAARAADGAWLSCPYGEIADADVMQQLCDYAAEKIHALKPSDKFDPNDRSLATFLYGVGDPNVPEGIVPIVKPPKPEGE